MSQILLSLPQIGTALRLSSLTPVPGSPLEGLGDSLLPPDHEGCVQMSAHRLFAWEQGGWRVNRAFALSLAVAAAPDEVIWVDVGRGMAGMTLCRRETFSVECSVRPDALVKWVFPQVWSLVPEMLAEGFREENSGDGPAGQEGFDFSGTPETAFLLSLIIQAAHAGAPCRLDMLQSMVAAALADPHRTVPFAELGCGDSLLKLMPDQGGVSSCAMSLIGAGLVNAELGTLRPVDSVKSLFDQVRPATAVSFRRRIFTLGGYATAELSAARAGSSMLTWSVEPRSPADPLCRWRQLSVSQFKAEVLRLLGWPPERPE